MIDRTVPAVGILCSTAAVFFTVWIVVPAPHAVLWLVSIIGSEWSLHFGALALVGIAISAVSFKRHPSRPRVFGIGAGLFALVFAAYPPLSSLPVAAQHDVELSLARYVFGSVPAPAPFKTRRFSGLDGLPLALDIYGLEQSAATLGRPAVVMVHGGSWRSGARSDFPEWNDWLVEQGFVVFDVEYRLTPQPNWQTATEDVQQAVNWIKTHAENFGVDSSRVALIGRSAGGQLALQAAFSAPGSIRAVTAFYSPTDLSWSYEHPANQRVINGPTTLRDFTGGTPSALPGVYQQASPISHVTTTTPPTLLIHGGQDQLVLWDNSMRLLDALQAHSDPALHAALLIPYAQHGYDYNFNGWGSQMTQAVMLRFLNEHLGSATSPELP